MKVTEPQSAEDFERYFNLRYEVLRKPWNQPYSSVKDDKEQESRHAMVVSAEGEVVGVCRMQFNSAEEAQLRFMGIREDMRGKELGKMLLDYFENIARGHGIKKIVLQSRENAVNFYKRNGYREIEKSYLLWGLIQHYLMQKDLA
jgi:N-acetylglutamate synthase-like GNAT family acetyltransferase